MTSIPEVPKGRAQWLVAGQGLLRQGGANAVKLQALTAAMGLTTGSFYHHFAGMADYLDQLAGYYGSDQPLEATAFADDPDPRVRLRRLAEISRSDHMGELDAAMRDWGGSNPLAAQAVHDADVILLRFVERAFRDLGYRGKAAQTRAHLLFAAGVARFAPPWSISRTVFVDVLEVLAPEAASTGQTRSVGRSAKPRAKRPASSAVRSQSKIT